MKNVVVIGAGGHGRVIAELVRAAGDNFVGFLDDAQIPGSLGRICDYDKINDCCFVVAIGNARQRESIADKLDVEWYTAVHPTAVISPSASIGEGSVIMANAVVNTGATVGRHCIINTGAIIEHDNVIEDFSHISVGAKLGGSVHIGRSSWISIGSTISNNISICSGCIVGTGAAVVKNIELAGTYVGVPAKKI